MGRSSRPRVILSAAVSIDGKIATVGGDSELSSERDIIRLHGLRSMVDAILVGINTVLADDPMLTVRRDSTAGRNPTRVILDSEARIPTTSKIITTSKDIPTIVAVSQHAPRDRLQRLRQQSSVDVVVAGTSSVDVVSLLAELAERRIDTVLVEGGGTVNWEFVRRGLFDEAVVTVSPFLLGGRDAVSLVEGDGFFDVHDSPRLHLKSVERLDDHIVLAYEQV